MHLGDPPWWWIWVRVCFVAFHHGVKDSGHDVWGVPDAVERMAIDACGCSWAIRRGTREYRRRAAGPRPTTAEERAQRRWVFVACGDDEHLVTLALAPARPPTWPACRSTASATPATCAERARQRRETAARVAAGSVAKLLLRRLGIEVISHVVQMGGAWSKAGARPTPADLDAVDASPVRCFDPAAEEAMVAEVEAAAKAGDSLGGIVEVLALGRARRARQPRALGPQARRAAGAGGGLVSRCGGGWCPLTGLRSNT